MAKECFAVPRASLVEAGFIPSDCKGQSLYTRFDNDRSLRRLMEVLYTDGSYRERFGEGGLEGDSSWQQFIIAGFVIRPDGRFLMYERGQEGQNYHEGRLAGKVALGLGGHIEPGDARLVDSFYREIDEEALVRVKGQTLEFRDASGGLDLRAMKRAMGITPVGLIKDETDAVSMDHIGLACRIDLRDSQAEMLVRTTLGENVAFAYVTPQEYLSQAAAGQIVPEAWSNVIFREEVQPLLMGR